jgi:hypothetical protein
MDENNEPVETEAIAPDPIVAEPAEPANPAEPEVVFDSRLYTKDGKFNPSGAKEFMDDVEKEKQKYEERLLGLRKVVSRNGEVVEKADDYFQDFAPPEKYEKFFSDDTPEETKMYMNDITAELANKYHDVGLNKQQAYEVSVSILELMEKVGVLDTRTMEQKYIDEQKFIKEQMSELGANASTLIREAETFIMNTPEFDAKQKNRMLDMIKAGDTGLVSVVHAIKDSFGSRTGGVPSNITALGGLKSDTELREEYGKASPERRNEIIVQRHKAGRTGKLFG